MKFITWDKSYTVYVEEIDAQHQWLIDIINTLYDDLQEHKGKKLLEIIMGSLMQYIQMHFSTEEQLMVKYHYPDYNKHKMLHEELNKKVTGWNEAFLSGRELLSNEMLDYLKGWLEGHEVTVDRSLGSFLNSHGVK